MAASESQPRPADAAYTEVASILEAIPTEPSHLQAALAAIDKHVCTLPEDDLPQFSRQVVSYLFDAMGFIPQCNLTPVEKDKWSKVLLLLNIPMPRFGSQVSTDMFAGSQEISSNSFMSSDSAATSKREDYITWDDYFVAVSFLSAMRSKGMDSATACIAPF